MNQKLIEGLYLNKYPVSGLLLNEWKTINQNKAYRVKLIVPQEFFGCIRDEIILLEEDVLKINF